MKKSKIARTVEQLPIEDRAYECSACTVTDEDNPTLYRSRDRACPFCGVGVILEVDDR